MKRARKPKPQRYNMTKEQIHEMCNEQVEKAFLLMATAAYDEARLDEDTLCCIAVRAARYAEHIDSKVVRLKEVSEILEKNTGIRWKW